MTKFHETEKTTVVEADGTEVTTTKEKLTKLTRNDEPDYIKIYTKMWAEFNNIPLPYRELFIQLALRMTYCNANDIEYAQLVNIGKPFSEPIMKELKWKEDMYKKGIRELTKSGAIKRVAKGVYQINPSYAGKGEWKYNPRLDRGGIEDLKATFSFKDKTVETEFIWADNGEPDFFSELNRIYREGLNVKRNEETVLKMITSTPAPELVNEPAEAAV